MKSQRGADVGLPPGKTIPLSRLRRVMCDLLHASRQVPLVAIERRLHLGALLEQRQSLARRPSWFALFLKAYALVSEQRPELRRCYLSFPCARLHEHGCNVAHVAIARRFGEEEAVLGLRIRRPERLALAEIDARIRRARTEPVDRIADFRRILRLSWWPGPLRRLTWWGCLNVSGALRLQHAGTFGVTGIGALGSASLHLLSPLTTTLTYGVFAPDGSVNARLFYDHRVLDGVQPAAALEHLEEVLCGPILNELRGRIRQAA